MCVLHITNISFCAVSSFFITSIEFWYGANLTWAKLLFNIKTVCMRMKRKQTVFIQICLLHFHANSSRLARDTTMLHVRRPSLPSEAYDPGGRAEAELKGDAPDTAAGTAGILVRAVAVAAALTSTSLRER